MHFLSIKKTSVKIISTVLLVCGLFHQSVNAKTWQINLQDADLKAFVNEVADITGKDFVIDPRVNGRVNIISQRALDEDEVYDLFLGVLDVNGIIAVPNGNTVQLVPDSVAKQTNMTVDLSKQKKGNKLVTRIFYLKNTSANEMLSVVRPFLPQYGNIGVIPSVNALVVSNKADALTQLENLIKDIDGGEQDDFDLITLENVTPETMLKMISELSTGGKKTGVGVKRLKLFADNDNSRIIIKGSEKNRAYIKSLVKKLDAKSSRRLGGLKVFKLKYASATHVAEMLRGLLNNQSLNSASDASNIQATSLLSGKLSTSQPKQQINRSTSAVSSGGSGKEKKKFSIIADQTQNAIIVNATGSLVQDIEEAIAALDSRRAQVLIQAAIIEVSGDSVDQLGIQWLAGGPNSGFGITNLGNGVNISEVAGSIATKSPSLVSSAVNKISGALFGLGNITTNNKGQAQFYGAILQALETTTNANLLSMPSILTLDNEQASILVGQNVPFITGSSQATVANTNPVQTIERKDVGINLTVVPHIGDGGTIRLEVSQEVSAVVPTSNNIKSSDIITNRRLIKTTVLAENQQTIALGGLMSEDTSESNTKVPLLGDLPLLGHLFKSKKTNGSKRNLIVFLQPTILYDGQHLSDLSSNRYQQLKILQLELDGKGNLNKLPRLTP